MSQESAERCIEDGERFGSMSLMDLFQRINDLEAENTRLLIDAEELREGKRYGLVWEDRPDAAERMMATHAPVLVEDGSRFVSDVTDPNLADSLCHGVTPFPVMSRPNLLISGDNLHALAALRKDYAESVDVIYIDPPYNTGNRDFIYDDHYLDDSDAYRHSKWLSFMDVRIRAAYELLAEDGMFFASIDDSEHARLKLLLDGIFGPENLVANMVWRSKSGPSPDTRDLGTTTEYVLAYAKNRSKTTYNRAPAVIGSRYKFTDEHVDRRGPYLLKKLDARMQLSHYSEALNYAIPTPDGGAVWPGGDTERQGDGWNWRWSKAKVEWGLKNGFIVVKEGRGASGWSVYFKQYALVNNKDELIFRTNAYENVIPETFKTITGNKELQAILGPRRFDYPKPIGLVKHLVNLSGKDNAIVLDFFAGSGTTAHAVASMNAEDGGARQAMIITDGGKVRDGKPQDATSGDVNRAGNWEKAQVNIATDIAYERVRRVLTGEDWADGKKHLPLGGELRYFDVEMMEKSAEG